MKKLFVLVIVFLSFMVFSCDDTITYTINVVNNCPWLIKVNITSASSNSTWFDIPKEGSHAFSGYENGGFYIYITNPDPEALDKSTDQYAEVRVIGDDTWTVTFEEGRGYAIRLRTN